MRWIVVSDLHGDWVSHGIRRFDEIEDSLYQAVDKAIELNKQRPTAFVCTGDIANPDNGPQTIRTIDLVVGAASKLSKNGVDSFWIAGNHDVFEDGSGETVLMSLRHIDRVFVAQKDDILLFPTWLFVGMPYVALTSPHRFEPSALVDSIGDYVKDRPTIFIASHLTNIPGVLRGEESNELQRGREIAYPVDEILSLRKLGKELLLVNGHFHKRQTVTLGDLTLEIPGSMARLTFGEENHRPCYLLMEDRDG